MKTKNKSVLLTVIGGLIVALVFLFGGAGLTVYAAQSALPGDTLYPLKTTLEQARFSMATEATARAELQMTFAQRRLVEISTLIAENRLQEIPEVSRQFDASINQAISEVSTIEKGDPERAMVLTARISDTLSRYSRTLSSMLDSVPAPAKADLQAAIDSSHLNETPVGSVSESEFSGLVESISPGAWIVAGQTVFIHSQTEFKGAAASAAAVGDFVKVHAALNADGDLVAREIELSARISDDSLSNGNTNANSNANGNDNSNDDSLNANSNDDSLGNQNSNDDFSLSNSSNTNGDDHSGLNANTNTNGDDNGGSGGKGSADDSGDDSGNDNGDDKGGSSDD